MSLRRTVLPSMNFKSLTVFASIVALFGLLAMVPQAQAQVTFNGLASTSASYPSTDAISPLAVDSNGDQFYVVNNGTNNILYKIPAGGSAAVLNSAFPYQPTEMAVNSSGTTLYFIYSDNGNTCNSLTHYQHVVWSRQPQTPRQRACRTVSALALPRRTLLDIARQTILQSIHPVIFM